MAPLYEDATFVVVAPDVGPCADDRFTLVPRYHVSVLFELSDDVAAVLAGLARLADGVRRAYGVDSIDLTAHLDHGPQAEGHLHFHIDTSWSSEVGDRYGASAERSSVVADAMAH